jgi:hypothetical protein
MTPPPVSFLVLLPVVSEGLPSPAFLRPDGTPGPKGEAVRFTFRPSPTPRDRARIDQLVHELAGGLREYLDLTRGIESTRALVLDQVVRSIWPDGRPSVEGGEVATQQDRIEAAWAAHDSVEMDGLRTMQGIVDRLLFMATWSVLIEDPPEGWASIADRSGLDEATFYAIWTAWNTATEGSRRGKS